MANQFNFGAVEIPPELHDALWAAHEALVEKQAHVGRLEDGKRDIEEEIAKARQELDEAKKSHVAGFSEIADGATALPAAAKTAKSKIAEIGGRVVGLEATLPDFENAIRAAKNEMYPLRDKLFKARRAIVRVFFPHMPRFKTKPGELNRLLEFMEDGTQLDLGAAMMLYLAAHDEIESEIGGAFPHQGMNPDRFFTFLGQFFRKPDDDEIAVFRSRFEAAIWGDREPPARVKMPKKQPPNDGVHGLNWDAMKGSS